MYEEGEDADRPAYQLRLSDLKGRGEPVKRRKREWEERPIAMNQFGQCLQLAQKVIDSFKVGLSCVVFCPELDPDPAFLVNPNTDPDHILATGEAFSPQRRTIST